MKPEEVHPVEAARGTLSDSTPEEEVHVEKRVYKESKPKTIKEVSTQVMH
jgi:hypothetical protein